MRVVLWGMSQLRFEAIELIQKRKRREWWKCKCEVQCNYDEE